MKLRWHYPKFVSTDGRTVVTFESADEFYQLPRIRELASSTKFVRWSIAYPRDLMIEMSDESFWVIAHLSSDAVAALDLPVWEMPVNKKAQLINRQLPAKVLLADKTLGRAIEEARAHEGRLEYRLEGDEHWTPKPTGSGISWGAIGRR